MFLEEVIYKLLLIIVLYKILDICKNSHFILKNKKMSEDKKETIIVNGEKVEVQAYKLKGGPNQDKWITLYTDKIKNRDSNHPTSDAVIIVASKPLSMKDIDWIEYNRAEIKNAVISPDISDIGTADSEKEKHSARHDANARYGQETAKWV